MRVKGFTLTELAFVVVIIVISIVLLTPFINNIRSRAKIIACEESLQEIGLGLKLYASEHGGKFPSSLGKLVEGGYVKKEELADYHYKKGYTIASSSDKAIVFDKPEKHKDKKHILYVSGDIKWEDK
jgi:competence protein ComGC